MMLERTKTQGELLAEAQIADDKRCDDCMKEVQTVLRKYNCLMSPVFHITTKGIQGNVTIEALPIIPGRDNGGKLR